MKISVITINYNNASELAYTLSSVANQDDENFEQIVVDGGSTDGSIDVIIEYAKRIKNLAWVSAKDRGIFDAMNKGVSLSSGEYLLFLNSGDSFASSTIIRQLNQLSFEEDVVIGKQNQMLNHSILACDKGLRYQRMGLFNYYMYGLPHQATLTKHTLFENNKYDISLKINADWKFYFEALIMNGASWKCIDLTIANFDISGVSASNPSLLWKEREEVFRSIVPKSIADDYLSFCPRYYYEVYRVKWLLQHPIVYRIYRMCVSSLIRILR